MVKEKTALSVNTENADIKKKKNNEKAINMVISASILAVSVLIFLFVLFIEPDSACDVNEDTYNSYLAFDNSLVRLETEYLNNKGFVNKGKVSTLLNAVEKELKQGISSGLVDSYNRESDNIYIKYTSGVKSVFVPHMEKMLSSGEKSEILCVEPEIINNRVDVNNFKKYISKKFKNIKYDGGYSVSSNAKFIQKKKSNSVKASLVNSQVSIENLKEIGSESIIIFEGHGVYNKLIDSCLVTGETVESWNDIQQYNEDIAEGNIIFTAFPEKYSESNTYQIVRQLTVTSKFFDKYLNNMNDTLVFLGACYSNKSDALANSFLSKGASAVLGYTDSISLEYEILTRTMFFNNLCKTKKTTVNKALDMTKEVTKSYDPWSKQKSGLSCYSRDDMENLYTIGGLLTPKTNQEKTESDTTATADSRRNQQYLTNQSPSDAPDTTTSFDSEEELYSDTLINAILKNESYLFNRGDDTLRDFAFIDLNFDGNPELVARYDSSAYSDFSYTLAYTVKQSKLSRIPVEMGYYSLINFFSSDMKPCYNMNDNRYVYLYEEDGENVKKNYMAYYNGKSIKVKFYSAYTISENEDGEAVYTYYDGDPSSEDTKEITEYEYDTINSGVNGQLREINLNYKAISADTWKTYTESGKRASLESSCNAFNYYI